MVRPLALPEILDRVAIHLGWRQGPGNSCFFHPQDLLACITVNSTWNHAFTPYLWRVFHDQMAAYWRIPQHSATWHTNHIRYAYLTQAPELIPIRSTQLRHLTLAHIDRMMDALNLLCTNKYLTQFQWLVPHSSTCSPNNQLVRYALNTVTSLTSLEIDSWVHSPLDDIIAIARNNPDLQSLTLGSLVNLKVGRTTDSGLLLNLTELHLEGRWKLNAGIEYLVRLCPRLSTLWFRADAACPYATLSRNVNEYCPVLVSLKCIEGSKDIQTGNVLHTSGISTLVNAPHFLIHLDLPVRHLTRDMCDALLDRHSNSLRTIRFYLRDADEEDFMCVNDILARCSNLTTFALNDSDGDNDGDDSGTDTWKQPWRAEDISSMLVVPWDCSNLKFLEIMGASPMCYLKDDWDDEGYHEYDSSDEQSNEQDASNDQDASDNQDNQSSISEETTQGMDVDTDSQWTFDVVMKDGEFNVDQKDDVKLDEYEVHDSFMEIDPTPTELAFDLVLELIDIDSTSKFLGALAGWLAILGWSLQTDKEPFELAIKRNYKRFVVNLFERVSEMPNIGRVTMRGLNATKAC